MTNSSRSTTTVVRSTLLIRVMDQPDTLSRLQMELFDLRFRTEPIFRQKDTISELIVQAIRWLHTQLDKERQQREMLHTQPTSQTTQGSRCSQQLRPQT